MIIAAAGSQQEVLQDEQHREDIHQRVDVLLLSLAGQKIDDHVGDDPEADALGDAVGEGHRDDADVAGDRFGVVREVQLKDRGDHQEAHRHQRRCRREGRDRQEDGGQEQGQTEEDSGDH